MASAAEFRCLNRHFGRTLRDPPDFVAVVNGENAFGSLIFVSCRFAATAMFTL
jgi:hypothetical protein